jgi:tRNA(Arg) A34 adenosine deaminase TadA
MKIEKCIYLPLWLELLLPKLSSTCLTTQKEQMQFVLHLASRNVHFETGSPFAAAIFQSTTGKLISVGVNQVVLQKSVISHAEIVAMMLSEQVNLTGYDLVTSSQPCAGCFGFIHWAKPTRLIYSTSKEDVEALGFDEGPLVQHWEKRLRNNTQVIGPYMQSEGQKVLKMYQGPIY